MSASARMCVSASYLKAPSVQPWSLSTVVLSFRAGCCRLAVSESIRFPRVKGGYVFPNIVM